ncbi:Fic family protein [Duganella sp. BuS-21]|uniref:Fic family protein n=1 Tax=Duganella sp. BuS-21 TaxID=2943848 RepID=UPI0035A5E2DB
MKQLVKLPFPWQVFIENSGCDTILTQARARLCRIQDAAERNFDHWQSPPLWLKKIIAPVVGLTSFSDVKFLEKKINLHHENFVFEICELIFSAKKAMPLQIKFRNENLIRSKRTFSNIMPGIRVLEYCPPYRIEEELRAMIIAAQRHCHLDGLLLSMIISANFVSVHPFTDGNGRASRFLLKELLREIGLWKQPTLPIEFLISNNRRSYVLALNSLIVGARTDYFIEYFSNLITAAAELYVIEQYLKYCRNTAYEG